MEIISNSPQETLEIGKNIAPFLKKGDVLLLKGDLGSGKTTLVKGLISQLKGCKVETITSPTFNYLNIFEDFCHFDLYRLKSLEEFVIKGFCDYLTPNNICCIEWPELVEPLIAKENLKEISIFYHKGNCPNNNLTRKIIFNNG